MLLAEDDLRLAAAVLRGLRGEGMVVDVADNDAGEHDERGDD